MCYTFQEVIHMPRQARKKSESGVYHVILRGINKQVIFEDEQDNLFFLSALSRYKQTCAYQILAYCLMNNHVHLVIQTRQNPLGSIIRRIAGKYSYWYNNKYQRVGHLFQDRYLSEPIDSDAYLLNVIRYVHQNPLVAQMVRSTSEYRFSSYNDYLKSDAETLTDTELLLGMMKEAEFVRFHTETSDGKYLEVSERKFYPTDEQAKQQILQITGLKSTTEVQKLDPETRGDIISKLKAKGLSVRQLSRLTGLSKSTIERH
jgi:REP element-mobilizing transposase RayT/DNA-binding transcriptional ArsR family regulator